MARDTNKNNRKILEALKRQREKEAAPRMSRDRVYEILKQIDDLNMQVGDLVQEIRDGGHPDAYAIQEG